MGIPMAETRDEDVAEPVRVAMGASREIDLADYVRDRVTGYAGTVVAKCRYMDGTTQIAVASQNLQDGIPVDWFWFDIKRATVDIQPVMRRD